ncbi:MAG: hypothetical protein AAB573_02825 [Patescibacteria group bacterium]
MAVEKLKKRELIQVTPLALFKEKRSTCLGCTFGRFRKIYSKEHTPVVERKQMCNDHFREYLTLLGVGKVKRPAHSHAGWDL